MILTFSFWRVLEFAASSKTGTKNESKTEIKTIEEIKGRAISYDSERSF